MPVHAGEEKDQNSPVDKHSEVAAERVNLRSVAVHALGPRWRRDIPVDENAQNIVSVEVLVQDEPVGGADLSADYLVPGHAASVPVAVAGLTVVPDMQAVLDAVPVPGAGKIHAAGVLAEGAVQLECKVERVELAADVGRKQAGVVAQQALRDMHPAGQHVTDQSVADLHVAGLRVAELHMAELHVAELHVAGLHVPDLNESDLNVPVLVQDGTVADLTLGTGRLAEKVLVEQ